MREVRNSFVDYLALLGAQIGLLPLSILILMLTVRLAGPTQYGIYALFLSVVQLFLVLGVNWTYPSIIRFGKEEYALRKTLHGLAGARIVLLLFCLIISAMVLVVFAQSIAAYIGIFPKHVWLVFAGIVLFALISELNSVLQVVGKMRTFAVLQAAEKLFMLAALLWIFLSQNFLSALLLMGIALGTKIILLFIALPLLPLQKLRPRMNFTLVHRVVQYSWPLLFAYASGYVIDWLDLFAIRYYLDLQAVGIYQIAYQAMLVLSSGLMVFPTLAFPILTVFRVRERTGALRLYLERLAPQFTLLWTLLLFGVLLVAPFAFPLLFGTAFAPAIPTFLVLLVGLGFQALMVLYGAVLYSHNFVRSLTITQILMAVLNVGLNILLIPRIGILGAALATAFAYMFSSCAYVAVVR
ncbi:MAG TPA: polysaccharide biosynthesis C-terminal domain-containing protein, partial [Candidatus Nanoarchaeia archaeon]|nr:polysaccharide biosynthesis C-terminal domain-containing protein [Candidatus Nanoarchaeia archaeon]